MSTEQKPSDTKPYRGFSDDFKTYNIGSITVTINKISFTQTEILEGLVNEFQDVLEQFRQGKVKDTDRTKAGSKLLKEGLKMILSPTDYELALNKVDKPTLFNTFKDIYAFLQVIGSKEELELLQMQSKSES